MVETVGNAPTATILQGSSAPCAVPVEHDPEKWIPVFGKDHAPKHMVPRVGFEPTSPRLQRGAFTRSASWANWCGRRESNPDLESGALALCLRAAPAWRWWMWHGFEPAQHRGAGLRPAGFSHSLHIQNCARTAAIHGLAGLAQSGRRGVVRTPGLTVRNRALCPAEL